MNATFTALDLSLAALRAELDAFHAQVHAGSTGVATLDPSPARAQGINTFLAKLESQDKTITAWAKEEGFPIDSVYAAVRGLTKGKRGKGRAILERMGALPPDDCDGEQPQEREREHEPDAPHSLTRRLIGQRLKQERQRLALSIEAAASCAGVTSVSQYRYETGGRTPDAVYLQRLAVAAGVDLNYVVTGHRAHAVTSGQVEREEGASMGARLMSERLRLGLLQSEASALAGVTRAMWSRYERGVATPGGRVLTKLAQAGFKTPFVLSGQTIGVTEAPR